MDRTAEHTYTLAVLSAGLGEPSSTRMLADVLAAATADALRERGHRVRTEVVELRERAVDIAHAFVTGFPAPALQDALGTVLDADGLVAVTPVFSASYSGLFKSFFDVVEHRALAGKPALAGATGGTERHSLVLEHAVRPLFSYLGLQTAPTAVYAAPDDWGRGRGPEGALQERARRAGTELAELMLRRGPARRADTVGESLPFEQLLANVSPR
ncbi:FMN reductase [Kocuria sp. U4B]